MDLKFLSIAGFCVGLFALTILVMRESILADNLVAILVQVFAVLLMLWARVTFGRRSFHVSANPTDGGLITTGPYHYIRHPIYASILYFLWAGIFSHLSLINIFLGIVVTFGSFIRIFSEEHLVTEQYPNYVEYAARTKRIIPFVL